MFLAGALLAGGAACWFHMNRASSSEKHLSLPSSVAKESIINDPLLLDAIDGKFLPANNTTTSILALAEVYQRMLTDGHRIVIVSTEEQCEQICARYLRDEKHSCIIGMDGRNVSVSGMLVSNVNVTSD
jgi:hypothetical protein